MDADQKVTDADREQARARAEQARRVAIAEAVGEVLNTPLRARLLARMRSVDVEFAEGLVIPHPYDASRKVELTAVDLVASHLYGLRSARVVVTGTGCVLDDAGQPFGQVRHDWPLPDALAADVLLFVELNGG